MKGRPKPGPLVVGLRLGRLGHSFLAYRRRKREEGKSLRADAAAQFKLLPVVNFIREVVDQNVI